MSNYNAIKVAYEPTREIAFGDIPANYTLPLVNAAATFYTPTSNSIRILKIINTTDANMYMSFSSFDPTGTGVNDNDYIPASSAAILDYCSNRAEPSALLEQQKNTQFQIRYETAPTKGKVVVVVIYATT